MKNYRYLILFLVSVISLNNFAYASHCSNTILTDLRALESNSRKYQTTYYTLTGVPYYNTQFARLKNEGGYIGCTLGVVLGAPLAIISAGLTIGPMVVGCAAGAVSFGIPIRDTVEKRLGRVQLPDNYVKSLTPELAKRLAGTIDLIETVEAEILDLKIVKRLLYFDDEPMDMFSLNSLLDFNRLIITSPALKDIPDEKLYLLEDHASYARFSLQRHLLDRNCGDKFRPSLAFVTDFTQEYLKLDFGIGYARAYPLEPTFWEPRPTIPAEVVLKQIKRFDVTPLIGPGK